MFYGHVSFASITMRRHVKGVVIVSQSHIVPPLVGGQDITVEMDGVYSERETCLTGSRISVFVGIVEIATILEYQSLLGELLFSGAHAR